MKKIAIAIGIVALLTAAVALAIAQGERHPGPPPPGMGPGGPEMMEHMARVLNLTDEQKAQIKAIHDAERAAVEPNEQKFGELHKQLEDATANGQFDEAKVRDLASQQAQLHVNMLVEHERAKSKIYNILTPEQRAKADELHKQMGGPGGPHGPGGPGGPRGPMRHDGPPPPPPPKPDNN